MYRYTRFGNLALPLLGAEQTVSARYSAYVLPMPDGGAYDLWGNDTAPRRPALLTCKGILTAATPAALAEAQQSILVAGGTRAKLYRLEETANREEWSWARLQEIRMPRTADTDRVQDVELDFALLSPCWYGEEHDDQRTLNMKPLAFVQHGNHRITNPVLTLTAKSSAITSFILTVEGVSEFQWNGTLGIDESLVIDCGARSVKKDGADAYAGFSLTENHHIPEWLRIEPGVTVWTWTMVGGGASSIIRAQYYDGWA